MTRQLLLATAAAKVCHTEALGDTMPICGPLPPDDWLPKKVPEEKALAERVL